MRQSLRRALGVRQHSAAVAARRTKRHFRRRLATTARSVGCRCRCARWQHG